MPPNGYESLLQAPVEVRSTPCDLDVAGQVDRLDVPMERTKCKCPTSQCMFYGFCENVKGVSLRNCEHEVMLSIESKHIMDSIV